MRNRKGQGSPKHRSRGGASKPKKKGFFQHKKSTLFTGRVQKNKRGFAFILSNQPSQPDAYVGPQDASRLLSGDVVEYQMRHDGKKSFAEIKRIIERPMTEVMAFYNPAYRRGVLETELGDVFLINASSEKPTRGTWVIAKIDQYPTHREPAKVTITSVLGEELLPEHDNLMALIRYCLPHHFAKDLLAEESKFREKAQKEIETPHPKRRDLRSHDFVTIDGDDAKDFDDAILVEAPKSGSAFVLYVAIADVSFFVTPGTKVDQEALNRSTSVYFPGTAIPMLPEFLSNDLCSLRPQEDKLTLVSEIHLNRDGEVEKTAFYEAIIRTKKRLTYDQVHAYYSGDPTVKKELESLERPLHLAYQLFKKLKTQRTNRGTLDFELPECKITVSPKGVPLEVKKAQRQESNSLIEEFMIAANQAVAFATKKHQLPSLYRVHENPSIESIDKINQLLSVLGIHLQLQSLEPKAFSKLLEDTKSHPSVHSLHQLILRSQKQAYYTPLPKGHFGLALKDYTHFTSPIRRYPDLVVHRALKKLMHPDVNADIDKKAEGLEKMGEISSDHERRAMTAERFILKRKQCWFFKELIGSEFEGVISSINEKGLYVEIPQFATDGYVPGESMKKVYEYDPDKFCLNQTPGFLTLHAGDKIKVLVDKVSLEDNQITFATVDL